MNLAVLKICYDFARVRAYFLLGTLVTSGASSFIFQGLAPGLVRRALP